MGGQSKLQYFPFSMRTTGLKDRAWCSDNGLFQPLAPDNALTIENLYTHFVMQFDAAIPVANQLLYRIQLFYGPTAATSIYQTINQQADANRRVDLGIDLTPLLIAKTDPSNIYIRLYMAPGNFSVITVGVIELWKTDAVYTTKGIR